MTTVNEYFSPPNASDICKGEGLLYGTEYEIEDVKHINYKANVFLKEVVRVVDDFSLRNNGKEFITCPSSFIGSLELFEELHEAIVLGDAAYSPRTSIHVHANVLDFSLDQLKHLLLLYAYLEPAFFAFAGDKRKHNIHCVPLNWTLMPKHYAQSIPDIVSIWNKYSAFNMKPVMEQGTVEFRHLYGTGNKMVYQQWLTMINDIMKAAFTLPPTWLQDNISKRSWKAIADEIFTDYFYLDKNIKPEDVQQAIVDVKLAFV